MNKYKYITDYAIIQGRDPRDLEQQVRKMFQDYWQPLGGAFIGFDTDIDAFKNPADIALYCQTMVRRVKPGEDEK